MGEDGGVVRMRHWWWWGGAFAKREAGEGGWGQKPQTETLGLDFGHAVGNGAGERWGEVVVYAVATASGRLVRETRGWRGFGPKTPKRAAVARFGAASGLQAEMGDGVGLQAPLPW